MYTIITIFYISLIGIVAMILLKRREVGTGKQSIVSYIGAGSDRIFNVVFAAVRKGISYLNKRTFIAVVQWIAYQVLFRIRKIYVEIKHQALMNPHSKKVIDAVRGRGQIQTHGASLYLRRISGDAK